MTSSELSDALDGLFAYDDGCVDSGVHDEVLRERVKEHLHDLSPSDQRMTLSRHVRDHFLSEEALTKGYGIEDVHGFIRWLADRMDYDL